jgi:hypothetical protein
MLKMKKYNENQLNINYQKRVLNINNKPVTF